MSNIILNELSSYQRLLIDFPPRPIYSEEQFQATLSQDERDYLNVLATLVAEYESEQNLPDVSGVEMLRHLMDERGLKQKDLVPAIATESLVFDILNGKRQLNLSQVKRLAQQFSVSPAVFI